MIRLTFNILLAEVGMARGDVRLMRRQHVASDRLNQN